MIAHASVYSNASQYSEAIKAYKKFASLYTGNKKNFIILQSNRLLNSSSA